MREIAPKNNKDAIDNQDIEQSAVDWRRKIYEKMEEIQTEQSKFNKYVENNFNTLFSEIEKTKPKQCNMLISDANKESSEINWILSNVCTKEITHTINRYDQK